MSARSRRSVRPSNAQESDGGRGRDAERWAETVESGGVRAAELVTFADACEASPDYRAAISALTDARTELGISQRELARRLGKPPSFINKNELVERRLDFLELIAIAEAMELKSGDLLARLRAALPEVVSI